MDTGYPTYSILAAAIGKNLKGVNLAQTTCTLVDSEGADITDSSGTYMTTLSTITTEGEVESVKDVKAVDGTTQLMLYQNKIMKARIYIWLEGQDADCNDTASTGHCSLPFFLSKTEIVFHGYSRNVIFTIFILTRVSQNRIISL